MNKKRLYFDMDGVIVDFVSALDAVRKLNEKYDCYILSTAPWNNPSAWSDKVAWITEHLDDVFHKKMIITLCKGDYLIDDRDKNGAAEFEGNLIRYGSEKFPDWDAVLEYLIP